MKHRSPKIWQTEDQILAAIDRTRAKAKTLLIEESELLKEASELLKQDDVRAAARSKEEAARKAKSYNRIIEKTLPRLGEILAAFNTERVAVP